MSIKIKLQISRKKYQTIEVYDDEEVKLVEELNRDFYRFEKSEQRSRARTISCDKLYDEYNYELPSIENDPFEKCLMEDKKEALYKAIDSLNEIEKRVFLLHVQEGLSFNKIASRVCLSKTGVIKKYNQVILKLQNLLKEYK